MPPKQKQAKKGPTYKNPVPAKDLISADIKEPPRQLKSLKYPQNIPQPPKNVTFSLYNSQDKKAVSIFQSWPAQQTIKTFDFGTNSQNKFQDSTHQTIVKHVTNSNIMGWKSLHQIQKIKNQSRQNAEQKGQSMKSINNNDGQSHPELEDQQNVQQGPYKQPVVIQTYERDQNQEQTQARLKKQAQKAQLAAKDKKKGKKQQPKQQGPIKVRDVKMADIKVEGYMAEQGIWIGSQLQIIKLRNLVDAYNKQPVWKKIYPQENGVPQITKSGKYWVKLYYMGQPIKIQVDDRLPINFKNKQMFPMSQNRHQKWTLILTKALIKYMTVAYPQQKISGSGVIFHALTGMITQSLNLKNSDLERFKELLGDSHYTNKDIFVCCHTNKSVIPPSNHIKSNRILQQGLLDINTQQNHQDKQLYQKQQTVYQYGQAIKPTPSNIILNYGYLLGDYFTNQDFNMAFSKQKSTKQSKLRQQYNNLSKVNLNNKTRDQKLQHRRKKKEIKQLLAIQEKKRLELINEEQKQYHFIKLLTKQVKIKCQFEQKQILLAKKCKINNLKQPPNYELPQIAQTQKQQSKSMKSFSLIKTTKQQTEVNPNIDDFSMLQNVIEPLIRPQSGLWIKDLDFLACFTKIQIVYNPAFFQHKSIQKIVSTDNKSFTYDQKKQILVLQKIQLNQQGLQTQNIQLLFGFSYQQNNDSNSVNRPYCILQKFDFDQFSVSSNITKLTNKIDSNSLKLRNQNNVFKIYTMCKGNYSYWISSNAKFKLMSISQYLQEFEGYKKKSFAIQYPALEKKTYFPLARFNIKQKEGEQNNSVILKLITPNNDLTKYLGYNLVNIPKEQKYVSLEDEGVISKICQKKLLALDYTRINIQPNQQYDLVLESCPVENVQDGSLEIIALIKNQSMAFQSLEQVQPLKIIEKYKPNKYGTIFRERLFSNTVTKQGFLIKIVQGEQVQGGGSGGDKKAAKKGGKQQTTTQYVQKPLQKERTFIFRVIKNKQIVYEAIGKNWISVSDICLPNIKQKAPNTQYFLQAYFDLRQWPEASIQSQDTAKLCWTISTFGTDSIALVRDTRQQDKQKQTRKSWEDRQPGRADRAKKTRRRFLLLQKKQNGQQLTEQQQQIIAAPRMTKKQQLQEQKKNEDKNKKGAKKEQKKGGKQVKKQQVQEKPVQIVFPKSIDNCSYQIKSFLKTLQNFSVKNILKPLDQESVRIRSQQELRAIKQSQKMSEQNRVNKLQRNIQRRETIKLKQRDKKDQLLIYLQDLNKQFKQNWTKYITWRNEDLEKDKTKQQKERVLLDILKQQKPTLSEADLDKILNQYQGIANFNEKLYDVAVMLKKNIKIAALSQKITNHLTGWEVQQLKAIREQIANQKIQGISQNIVNDMKTMLQQAQKNPAIVLQKQNQAKKGKKGGKK